MKENVAVALLSLPLGISLAVYSSKINGDVCGSDKLSKYSQGALIISVFLIALSVSFFGCRSSCKCSVEKSSSGSVLGKIYLSLMAILGIVLIVLGALMDKEGNNIDCETAKNNARYIWGMGIGIFLLSSPMLIYLLF